MEGYVNVFASIDTACVLPGGGFVSYWGVIMEDNAVKQIVMSV